MPMMAHKKTTPQKNWDDYTKQEQRRAYVVLGTVSAFILLWMMTSFRSALAMVLLAYGVYFIVKAVRTPKTQRKGPIIVAAVLLVAMAVVVPQSPQGAVESNATQSQQAASETAKKAELERVRQLEAAKPQVRSETKTEPIEFTSIDQNDSTLPLGERKLSISGVNGERTVSYDVTYVNGLETTRSEVKREILKQPVQQVTLVGTYVKPAATSTSSSGDGYTNSQGNHVASPSSSPSGATARCGDGTYSYSQSRRGTCSHHGGVATWL